MDERIKVMLCEDDEALGPVIREMLLKNGFDVDLYPDGEKGLKGFMRENYDLCIIDVNMPKKDGFSLAKDIKSYKSQVPIIFLTAKSLKDDILEGFKIGADDYITKPFSMEELVLRIEAIIKRVKGKKSQNQQIFKFGNFEFNTQTQVLKIHGKEEKLTTKESQLLGMLCANVDDHLDRNEALLQIWNDREGDKYGRSMDVYITKLRKKLSEDKDVEILNIHGKGYKLIIPESGMKTD